MKLAGVQAEYACISSALLNLIPQETNKLLPLLWETHTPCRVCWVSLACFVPVGTTGVGGDTRWVHNRGQVRSQPWARQL
jgi:hypothetical protein